MSMVYRCLPILITLVVAHCSQIPSNIFEQADPSILKAVINYLHCAQYSADGECSQCSRGYYFDSSHTCTLIDPYCKQYNRAMGICEKCFQGYKLSNGQCTLHDLAASEDKGCKTFKEGECIECSSRWFFNLGGFCEQVSEDCRTWDNQNGDCTTCYKGYQLTAEGSCKFIPNNFQWLHDPLCSRWKDRVCLQCAQRAFFGPLGFCIPVSDQCKTWDRYDGICLTCYEGYSVRNGKCELEVQKGPEDLGCKLWDWDFKVCLECSARWVFDQDTGICRQISTQCRQFSVTGDCTSCYTGYSLNRNGRCLLSDLNNRAPPDPGCKIWDWESLVCEQCSFKWYRDNNGSCQKVDPLCKDHNEKGQCTQCFPGFVVSGTKCVRQNPLCKEINSSGNCSSCYSMYALFQGRCVPLVALVNHFEGQLKKDTNF